MDEKVFETDATANRVVRRTINVIGDNPDLPEEPRVNEVLLSLLRKHAFDERDWGRAERGREALRGSVRTLDGAASKPIRCVRVMDS